MMKPRRGLVDTAASAQTAMAVLLLSSAACTTDATPAGSFVAAATNATRDTAMIPLSAKAVCASADLRFSLSLRRLGLIAATGPSAATPPPWPSVLTTSPIAMYLAPLLDGGAGVSCAHCVGSVSIFFFNPALRIIL